MLPAGSWQPRLHPPLSFYIFGRGYYWERDGFTFDAGPTVITDPDCLTELWALSGHDIAADVELMPVKPFYRLNWPDGTNFDYSNDEPHLRAEIDWVAPGDAPPRATVQARLARPGWRIEVVVTAAS